MADLPVSVIIPAFNAAAYLGETLASVLAQSRTPAEVIVVDDGSTDGTAEIARRHRGHVTLLQVPNGGQAVARNRGAQAARTDWLAFLDADDVWLPDKLARQWALADDRTGLIYCDRFNVGRLEGLPLVQSDVQPLVEGDIFEHLLLSGNVITTSAVLLRRSLFDTVGGFSDDPQVIGAEDWDLWLRIAEAAPVRACHAPLVKYRLHLSGASRVTDRMNRARVRVVARALASARGRALDARRRRQIWSATWATNAWDAARHKRFAAACSSNLRAIGWWPFASDPYLSLARIALGRA